MLGGLKFIDVFSGIGGLRQGFEKNGHTCIAFSEIDKHAIQSYKAIYGDNDVELGDISVIPENKLKELGRDVELVVGGSPCTAFSIAGKKGGFEDTRGSLFFEYCRTLKYMQPKYFLFENVKGVLSHDQGRTIDTMIRTFNEVGYTVDLNLVNSKYFGVPQHRERIFVVGVRSDLIEHEEWVNLGRGVLSKARQHLKDAGDIRTFNFDWPKQEVVKVKLKDVLETNVHDGYYINEEKAKKLIGELKSKDIDNSDVQYLPTLTPDRVERRQMGRRFKEDGDPAFTLTALDRHGVTIIKGEGTVEEKEANTLKILRVLQNEVGEKEIAKWRLRVLDSFQQTEVLRQNMYEETLGDGRYSEVVRKQQQNKRTTEDQIYDGYQSLSKVQLQKEFRRSPQGRESLQQFHRELASVMQKLPPQDTSIEVLCDLWQEAQGVGVLRQALSEIQEIWRPELHKGQSYRIRRLTPLETRRLQSFSDEDFFKVKNAGMSDSQLYKQAGNAVTVNVIDAIAKKMNELHTYLNKKSEDDE